MAINKDKRTRLIYLGQKRVAITREYSNNYKRFLAIVEEMTLLKMEYQARRRSLTTARVLENELLTVEGDGSHSGLTVPNVPFEVFVNYFVVYANSLILPSAGPWGMLPSSQLSFLQLLPH